MLEHRWPVFDVNETKVVWPVRGGDCLMLHEQEVASAVDPGWLLSTVINGAGRHEPVHDDQIVVAQLRDERLKSVLDAEASLEVLRPRLQLRSYGQP